MLDVRAGLVIGLATQLAVLGILAGCVGLGVAGCLAAMAWGVTTVATLGRALARSGSDRLGPANWVTLARATLVGAVTAVVVDAFFRPTPPTAVVILVALASVALVLDGVDGWVARRTATCSPLGARFDVEVDAFLILVLGVYAAHTSGAWVIAIGAARYVFVGAGWLLPWMIAALPFRYWRKAVGVTQGVVLTVAAADVLPRSVTEIALATALLLLAESFGRDVRWLWCHRRPAPITPVAMLGHQPRDAWRTVNK